MGILDIFTGGALGAIGGAISTIGSGILKLKEIAEERETLKVKCAHELQLRDKDLAQLQAEAASKAELARVDAEVRTVAAELDLQAGSYENDKATYGPGMLGQIVDFMRGVTRPVSSWVSLSLICWVTHMCIRTWGFQPPTPEQANQLLRENMALAATCVGWWFGARVTGSRLSR